MNKTNPEQILKEYFSYSSFRSGQREIIDSVLAGSDTVGIMPTGSGKSLCYQIPAVILPGTALIISPLIALMKDQVDALTRLGISAAFINSSLSAAELNERMAGLRNHEYKLVYIAPERFRAASFNKIIKQLKVSLIAVDEAHCISQWGHDFRPSYMKIKDFVIQTGRPPVLALTATATKTVQQDIVKQLHLEKPQVVVKGFDRPNLKFFAVELDNEGQKDQELIRIIKSINGPGIVYTATQKAVLKVCDLLNENGLSAAGYHGGMERKQRTEAQNSWLDGRHQIIAATNAFGMGIDKADVRFVIHYNLPGSVEAYYQEAGRAGRDSKTSYCVLFYIYKDRIIQEYLIENNFPPEYILQDIYEYLFSLGKNEILLTYKQIGEQSGCSEFQTASAVKLFERYNLLKRMDKTSMTFEASLLISQKRAKEKVKRAPLQQQMLDLLGRSTVEVYSLEETLKELQISLDQFNNTMRQLVGKGILIYTPPFRGRGLLLTSEYTDWKNVKIDFQEYDNRRKLQQRHLDEIENYVTQNKCRRTYLLNYFGELHEDKNCRACDICLNWKPPQAEKTGKRRGRSSDMNKLLDCVLEFDGRFGVTTIAGILKGEYQERFASQGINASPSFGVFEKKKREKIIRLIFLAVKKGFLSRSSGEYPVLEVTAEGLQELG